MKKIVIALVVSVFFVNCQNESPYQISKNSLGNLNASSTIQEVETLFPNDSVVRTNMSNRFKTQKQDIEIYNKSGDLIAVLEPRKNADSTSTFKQARLTSEVFKTNKGFGPASTFKDMYENYTISSIQNAISNVIVSVDELGVYASINKKHLPEELRYDLDLTINATQIPDDAPFQYFWLSFEKEE